MTNFQRLERSISEWNAANATTTDQQTLLVRARRRVQLGPDVTGVIVVGEKITVGNGNSSATLPARRPWPELEGQSKSGRSGKKQSKKDGGAGNVSEKEENSPIPDRFPWENQRLGRADWDAQWLRESRGERLEFDC